MISYFTDGSASPNPGPGGFSVIKNGAPFIIGGESENSDVSRNLTTNIRMEGLALLAALQDFLASCHPERSEGSREKSEILRINPQNDRFENSAQNSGTNWENSREKSEKNVENSREISKQIEPAAPLPERNDEFDFAQKSEKIACEITTDSEFWINVLTKWAENWQKNNWQKKGGIKNLDIVRPLFDAWKIAEKRGAKLKWTRGHVGTKLNELADFWANEARKMKISGARKVADLRL